MSGSGYNHSVGYTYDNINNLTALAETINGSTRTTSYTYDNDNRITQTTNSGNDPVSTSDDISEFYNYDTYGRLNNKVAKNGNTAVLTDAFEYRIPTTGTTSSQVAKLISDAAGYDVTYEYGYDNNGNIASVKETVAGTSKTTSYVYDSANQLTRENNQAAGKTWVWTYDDAGNITSRKEFPYTTGSLESVQSIVNYTYGDSAWGDLLTAWNGKTITSDTIGNMLSDGTRTYTWEHGRELSGLTHAIDLAIVKQPEDYIGRIGDTVSFSVEARGDGLSYQWQVSNNGGSQWSNSTADGYNTAIASMQLAGYNPGYLYRCKVTDEEGNVVYSEPGEIISAPIVIDTQPEDCYGDIGDPVSFAVSARGEGLTYQWQVSLGSGAAWYDSTGDGYATSRIYGFDISEDRVGRLYRCKITDANGNVVYTEAGRICLDGLSIVSQPEDYIGRVGDTVSFSVEARGDGLSYQWQVSNNGGSQWSNSTADGYNTANATMRLAGYNPGYLYRCKVTDEEGNVVYSEPAEIVLLAEAWSFTYNADGLRTKRTNGSTTYTYVYDGSSLSQLTVAGSTLNFSYDASGTPLAVTYNGVNYYYATNLQGDVVAILNTRGSAVVEYTYDAWGKLLTITGVMAPSLGVYNPLRYRGYVYDEETGLYYLQSRYYNPTLGRFINADAFTSTGQGLLGNNMFAYCNNNPVNMVDASGNLPKWIEDGINWFNENVIEPLVQFIEDVKEDADAFDIENESEEKVLESNYFSSYKGVPVFRTNGDRSGSFYAIFLTRETNQRNNPEDVIRHEYGHTLQFEELGIVNYTMCIMIPSWQMWGSKEYHTKPWEITADLYGRVQSRNHAESDFMYGFAYLDASKHLGPLIWLSIE